MEMVRSKSGAATALDFVSGKGTPVVVDTATGICYVVKANGSIVEIGSLLSALTVSGLISADGGQIKFPATQNPSANVNTLDDYEEGTWTPVDASGASLSFVTAVGTYTKVGRKVTVHASIVYPATASGAGALIGGLPFALNATYYGIGACYTTTSTALIALAVIATTTFAPYSAASSAQRTNAQMTGSTLITSFSYEV